MRDKFIGDSLDMSKGAVLALLACHGLPTLVCPLPATAEFDFGLYSRVLGISSPHILFDPPALRFRGQQRNQYLKALGQYLAKTPPAARGVALLDPDKGLCEGPPSNLFLRIGEVVTLARHHHSCTFAIYHHKNAAKLSYPILVRKLSEFSAFAYDFGAAALLFMGAEQNAVHRILKIIRGSLNPARVMDAGIQSMEQSPTVCASLPPQARFTPGGGHKKGMHNGGS